MENPEAKEFVPFKLNPEAKEFVPNPKAKESVPSDEICEEPKAKKRKSEEYVDDDLIRLCEEICKE
jgi:hypothetical protein